MSAPHPRPPRRWSDNVKRRLLPDPSQDLIQGLLATVSYQGSPKHKRHPRLLGLPPFRGTRSDSSYCEDAGLVAPHGL